jgi:hypothetical protein
VNNKAVNNISIRVISDMRGAFVPKNPLPLKRLLILASFDAQIECHLDNPGIGGADRDYYTFYSYRSAACPVYR